MRTLSLTSPPMKGKEVKDAQRALKEYGAWTGKIDGVYGEFTARATAQAKYRLGYADKHLNRVYGPDLHKFLTGQAKPTLLMQRRAKKRAEKKDVGEAALGIALQYEGVKEDPPNSNRVMFSEWYGMIGPWCAMYVTYCFTKAGAKHFNKNAARWAYCPYMLNDARAQRHGLTVVPADKTRPGDIVLFDWARDGVADHVGILMSSINKAGGFTSIEGNTGANNSDGGMVMIRGRNTKQVIAFIRVWE
jgi:hypothetical protein